MNKRHQLRASSNNPANTNKNICVGHVASVLGVYAATRYLHTFEDLMRAIRTRFSFRSVRSVIKGDTVGAMRKALARHDKGAIAYVVVVKKHVLLLNASGETIVDTAPRQRDKRKVVHVYAVYPKKGVSY